MFIIAIILAILAVIAFVVGTRSRRAAADGQSKLVPTIFTSVGAGLALFAALALFASTFYTQDVGEAKVLKDWTGNIVGEDITPGADFKAPWVDVVDFDIRNQIAAYVGDGLTDYNGSTPNGPQIKIGRAHV